MAVSETTLVVVHPPLLLLFLLTFFTLITSPTTSSSIESSLVYCGCSQYKYMRGSTYESNVNSMLTSLVNSATSTTPYNQFTIPASTAATPDTVDGFFQCRGDLSSVDCFNCVSRAVSQLGTFCVNSAGGALQLEGCLIKYDNATFLGVEDKTVLFKKCGPLSGYYSDTLTRRDAVLAYIGTDDGTNKPYRYSASSGVQAMAQCAQHLDQNKCQDCLTEAIGQLKTTCGAAKSGDMYLGTCYVRYSEGGDFSSTGSSSRSHQIGHYLACICVLLIYWDSNSYMISSH